MAENDPDTLQLLDELDKKWVNSWKNLARKLCGKKASVDKLCPSCGSRHMTIDRSNHIQTIACSQCGFKEFQAIK